MGIETIFQNFLHSSVTSKKPEYRPLVLKTSMKNAVKRIQKAYKKHNYINTYVREEYGEVYGEQYPYQNSCHLIQDGSKILLHIMVYNIEGRKKRKEFLRFRSILMTELEDLLDLD